MNDLTLRLILNNLRSAVNVGSLLRTADACRVERVYACGYTPYPRIAGDERPPHIIASNHRSIAKSSLGAELTVPVVHVPETASAIAEAKRDGFDIIVIEQAESSLNLFSFVPASPRLALVLGNEVSGVEPDLFNTADSILELPMGGQKESLGVAVAGGITLYQLRYGAPRSL